MALPEGYEEKSQDEWMALAESGDAAERKQVTNCLRALQLDPPMFLTWKAAERVAKIMEFQEGTKPKSKGASKGASKKGAAKGKGIQSKSRGSKAPSSSGGGGSVDLGPLEEQVAGLESKLEEVGDALDVAMEYIRESHTMMRVFFQTDEQAKNNLEEVGNYFHGKLLGLEEEEGGEDD